MNIEGTQTLPGERSAWSSTRRFPARVSTSLSQVNSLTFKAVRHNTLVLPLTGIGLPQVSERMEIYHHFNRW